MTTAEKLGMLRAEMKKRGIFAYIVPSDDFHGSEYVGDYFKLRAFLSGFTGSAGTLVVTENEAALWTDGRYFIQAAQQLAGSEIVLMKMGEPGVPTMLAFLSEKMPENSKLGFDARTITSGLGAEIEKALAGKNIEICGEEDLGGMVWTDRPEFSKKPVWALIPQYEGLKRSEKLANVRDAMKKQGTDMLLLAALDEIAWLLNIRGGDVSNTPVFLSFMIITEGESKLFAHKEIFSKEIADALESDGITILPYEDIDACVRTDCKGKSVWAGEAKINYSLMNGLADAKSVYKQPSPIELMKAVKTKPEQEGMIAAHIRDGVAVTRFMYWLKNTIGKEKITEMSGCEKLLEFRKMQDKFVDSSFDTILGYTEHAAICHYAPSEESDVELKPESFALVDSGAHYQDGTTDITRTIALGELTDEEVEAFTLVLKGHLNLSAIKFPYGVGAAALDVLARGPLWAKGLDYNHGTGHGVGYILSVHEGPHRLHWNSTGIKNVALEEGMVVSNEPGLYVEGKFGIRHENLVMVVKDEKTQYGQFMKLKNLTMVPFDLDGIDFSMLSDEEVEILNAYHEEVYENISPFLEGAEKEWLRDITNPIVVIR